MLLKSPKNLTADNYENMTTTKKLLSKLTTQYNCKIIIDTYWI